MEDNERYARYTPPGGDAPELGLLIEGLVDDARGYFETQRELMTLSASEKGGRLVAYLMLVIVAVVLLAGVLVMLSLSMGLWLGDILGSLPLGFLAMAGVHAVLVALFYLLWRTVLRDKIILTIINAAHGKD